MKTFTPQGTYTAIVTPFVAGGAAVDFAALERLVDEQIAGGVAGLVPCGTTGESPTLGEDEQREVVRVVARRAAKRVPVLAGTGSFSTKKTIAASRSALEAGADAVMVVMPYYNKPSQEGLCEHVLTVARAVDAAVVLYNIPGRTGVDLSAEATERICAAAPNVVAVKDATGNVLRCQELKRRLGSRLTIMSGDDGLSLPMMAVGASGVISVTSNVLPRETAEVASLFGRGELEAARAAHFRLLPLHGAMFVEPNPAPAKAALAMLGRMLDDVRQPLLRAGADTRTALAALLVELGHPPTAA